jgi:hypothetical protein
MKAKPDDFVVLFPVHFSGSAAELVRQTHQEVWMEEIDVRMRDTGGAVRLEGVELQIVIDEPIEGLAELAFTSPEPFAGSATAMLDNHTAVWRVVGPSGRATAEQMLRFMGTMIESGAAGAFLPGIRRLHSPRTIQRQTMTIDARALTNIFVSAFDRDDWMRTRGLTSFGLPELQTPIVDGPNAAFFRLMDVASAMIGQDSPFQTGSRVQLGPYLWQLVDDQGGIEDTDVPVNGVHGLLTLRK